MTFDLWGQWENFKHFIVQRYVSDNFFYLKGLQSYHLPKRFQVYVSKVKQIYICIDIFIKNNLFATAGSILKYKKTYYDLKSCKEEKIIFNVHKRLYSLKSSYFSTSFLKLKQGRKTFIRSDTVTMSQKILLAKNKNGNNYWVLWNLIKGKGLSKMAMPCQNFYISFWITKCVSKIFPVKH